jgi:DNA-binding transcriptional MerR regulator
MVNDMTVMPGELSEQVSYSGRSAAEIVGITYRQLDYWARTDLVRPSVMDASGSGSRRRYSYSDLLELKVIKSLLDAGIRLESVRQVFQYVREHLDEDVSSANIVISGTNTVLVKTGEELIDVLRKGQGVLNVLPLSGVKDEVDARIVELFPTATVEDRAHHPSAGAV